MNIVSELYFHKGGNCVLTLARGIPREQDLLAGERQRLGLVLLRISIILHIVFENHRLSYMSNRWAATIASNVEVYA